MEHAIRALVQNKMDLRKHLLIEGQKKHLGFERSDRYRPSKNWTDPIYEEDDQNVVIDSFIRKDKSIYTIGKGRGNIFFLSIVTT